MRKGKDAVKEHIQTMCTYNEHGEEILDPRPLEIPVGFKQPESIQDRIRKHVRSELLARVAEASGLDTFEEAEDFGPEDDLDPLRGSPYEDDFEGLPAGMAAREAEIKHGAVLDRTPEQKRRAYERIKEFEAERQRKMGESGDDRRVDRRKNVDNQRDYETRSRRDDGEAPRRRREVEEPVE